MNYEALAYQPIRAYIWVCHNSIYIQPKSMPKAMNIFD